VSSLQILGWGFGLGFLAILFMMWQGARYQPRLPIPQELASIQHYGWNLFYVQLWHMELDRERTMIWVRILFLKFGFQVVL